MLKVRPIPAPLELFVRVRSSVLWAAVSVSAPAAESARCCAACSCAPSASRSPWVARRVMFCAWALVPRRSLLRWRSWLWLRLLLMLTETPKAEPLPRAAACAAVSVAACVVAWAAPCYMP